MIRVDLLRVSRSLLRFTAAGLTLLTLTHCGDEGRARRFPTPQLQDRLPPSSELDASVPEDEVDASMPMPLQPVDDAGDDFVKFWDGSTTPTSDHVRHDAGDVDVRGSDVPDAGTP